MDAMGGAAFRRELPGMLIAVLSATSVLGMLGVSSFSALLPEFARLWRLSNTEAGWISGIFFAGYIAAVPVLVGSTDRVDPRRIYLLSLLIGAAASVAYALLAQGFWTALLFRALAGVGLAGTYMPGLKLLTDRTEGPRQSRYVAYYTAGFSLGTAISFAFTGELAQWFGWRGAFLGAAVGSLAAWLLILVLVRPARLGEGKSEGPRRLLDFRPVFRNRAAMAFVLGYTGHTWELFALRSWLVAFLIHAEMFAGRRGSIAAASWLTTLIVLASTAASIYGAEIAARSGEPKRVIGRIMLLSVAIAAATGFSTGLPLLAVVALCLVYHMMVMGDSAALTAGAVLNAAPGQRGATLAVHSILGFGGGFLGPLAVGSVLDHAGGDTSRLAWGLAFLAMGAGSAAAFVAVKRV